MKKLICILFFLIIYNLGFAQKPPVLWTDLASPEVGKLWIQPVQGKPAQPVWGHVDGIRVGIAPMPGPRGLLRIYAPYLGLAEGRMINFIAVEPIPLGASERGFSELEISDFDNKRGKVFWSADDSLGSVPGKEENPARGIVTSEKGIQVLTVYIFVEPYRNKAIVYLRLKFYEDRPYEVEITPFVRNDSQKLAYCILTATMGNLARLRNIYLEDSTRSASRIWPEYWSNAFAPHAIFPVKEMIRDKNGYAYFIAAPDEKNPQKAEYSTDTNAHWRYEGKVATQYWYSKKPDSLLAGLVNGRVVYWASKSPIPGGIAFENFELKEPFRNNARFVFGVTTVSPEELIKKLHK